MQVTSSFRAALLFLLAGAAAGQDASVEPRHVPRAPERPFFGEVVVDGRTLCAFSSGKADDVPWGILDKAEPRPEAWVRVSPRPSIIVRLSIDSPNFSLLGPGDALVRIGMQRERQADASVPTYAVTFDAPLPPGDYQFGGHDGVRPLFFRCGFTVKS